jgi:hypothetical protein
VSADVVATYAPMVDDGEVDPADVVVSRLTGLDLVVTSGLPLLPSDGTNARRIVRHGFHDAGLLPSSCGPVGPRPGEPTRALRAGRILFVDRELALEIDRRAELERRNAAYRDAQALRWRSVLDRTSAALGLDRDRVSAFKRDDRLGEITVRASLDPFDPVDVVVTDEDIARSATSANDINGPAALLVSRLRAALVERRLDDEEAGRGR